MVKITKNGENYKTQKIVENCNKAENLNRVAYLFFVGFVIIFKFMNGKNEQFI